MPVPGSLDPLTSTTEELCGCLGRGSTGPSSRRAGRGPGHKTRVAAPAGEPGASHKGRLGGRLRQHRGRAGVPWAMASSAALDRNCAGMFVRCTSSTRSCSERRLSSRVVATLLAIVPLLLLEPTRRPLLSLDTRSYLSGKKHSPGEQHPPAAGHNVLASTPGGTPTAHHDTSPNSLPSQHSAPLARGCSRR